MKFLDSNGVQKIKEYVDGKFITSETDPVFTSSAAAGITSSDITNWNNKTDNIGTVTGVKINGTTNNPTSGVVDLGTVLTSYTETDPTVNSWAKSAQGYYILGFSNGLPYDTRLGDESGDKALPTWHRIQYENYAQGVKVNGTTKYPTSGIIDIGTVVTDASGLQTAITSSNKLSADLISDGTTNKVVTATEKSTWNGKQDAITSSNKLDYSLIANTPTIPAAVTESTVSGWGFTKNTGTLTGVSFNGTNATVTNGVAAITTTIPTVNDSIITIQKGETNVDSFTTNASAAKTINIPNELPSYSSSDSGKILSINSSGQLVWITPAHIYSGTSAPDANTGNNGDVYLQS